MGSLHIFRTLNPRTMKNILTALFLLLVFCVQAQVKVSNDTMHWNANTPLQWSDFKGEPEEGTVLKGQVLCINLAGFQRKSAHHHTQFHIVSVFDRLNSWMPEKDRTDATLKYYQVMFNIYELHSRKMREAYTLSRTAKDPEAEFKQKYANSANDRVTDLNKFKLQTKYGMDTTALETWKVKLDEELNALSEYVK